MTLAEQFIQRWHNKTRTRAAQLVAKDIDYKVLIVKNFTALGEPFGFRYYFSDSSKAKTTGKGRGFEITLVEE